MEEGFHQKGKIYQQARSVLMVYSRETEASWCHASSKVTQYMHQPASHLYSICSSRQNISNFLFLIYKKSRETE